MKQLISLFGFLCISLSTQGQVKSADELPINPLEMHTSWQEVVSPQNQIKLNEWEYLLLAPQTYCNPKDSVQMQGANWIKASSSTELIFDGKENMLVGRTTFHQSPEWNFMEIFLSLEEVTGKYRLYINGALAGGSSNSFEQMVYNVSPFVKEGENRVLLICYGEDELSMLEALPAVGSYGVNSEIVLTIKDKLYLSNIIPTISFTDGSSSAYLETAVEVKNHLLNERPIEIEYKLISPDKKIIYESNIAYTAQQNQAKNITFSTIIKDAVKWSADEPQLYTIEIKMLQDSEVTECISKQIGLRKVSFNDGILAINGKAIKIVAYDFAPSTLADSLSVEEELNILKRRKGINLLVCQEPLSNNYLDACDKIGMYVIDLFPINNSRSGMSLAVGGSLSNDVAWKENHLSRIARRYSRNNLHPSIIGWSIMQGGANGFNIQESYLWLKAKDNERPILNTYSQGEWDGDKLSIDVR